MHRVLEEILSRRRERVRAEEKALAAEALTAGLIHAGSPHDPAPALRESGGFFIAEVKRASPSKGILAEGVDVAERARAYERGGASAVSVLCEPDFFNGSAQDVATASAAVSIPVLYKDFVVDPYQLLQARSVGARWVLLIARVLGDALHSYTQRALALGLEPLVEVHSEREMALAADSGARLIGINARDLDTFEVDLGLVKGLASRCPDRCACIAESGIHTVEDLLSLRDAGAHGFLIGESLMRAKDPEALLRSYREACTPGVGVAG